MLNINVFTIYETLQNFIKILPIIYQDETKMPGKVGCVWFVYMKRQSTSTIYKKLFRV